MPISLARQVLSLHPGIVTMTFVLLYVGSVGGAIFFHGTQASLALFLLIPTAFLVTWMLSLRRLALETISRHAPWRTSLLLLGCALAVLLLLLVTLFPVDRLGGAAGSENLVSLMLTISVLSYLAVVWTSSDALSRFESGPGRASLHASIGTALLVFYLPIGIWFLRSRVKRLLAAS